MKYTSFQEDRFRQQVEQALITVRKILQTNRAPVLLAEDVQDHVYQDKYALAEILTNTSLAAHLTVLQRMGLTSEHLSTIAKWINDEKKTVTLRFSSEDSCIFGKEQEVNVVNQEYETEVTLSSTTNTTAPSASSGRIWGGAPTTSTVKNETFKAKVMSKVREFHWKISFGFKLVMFPGTDASRSIELQSRDTSTVLITTTHSKTGPLPEHTVHPPIDVDLTWFFNMISTDQQLCRFAIDRSNPETCVTPRRNGNVQEAIEFYQVFSQSWARSVELFMHQRIEGDILGQHAPAAPPPKITPPGLGQVATKGIFSPILPLFQQQPIKAADLTSDVQAAASGSTSRLPPSTHATEASPLLAMQDMDELLQEHGRSLDEAFFHLSKSYPPKTLVKLVSVTEASLVLETKHLQDLGQQYIDSMDYLEHMLRQQLIAAIGKVIRPHDFDQFMSFHLKRLFNPQYTPKPFMYAIRRPNHYPDGLLSIEVNEDERHDNKLQPVETMVRHISGQGSPPIYVPINSATRLEITGDRYLHGWIQHRFSSASRHDFQLVARARQFSSFLLMVGTMAGPDQFDPQDAIILQNKDEVLIPLLLNELPTAREFRDAIASLSPEQQRFAQSFRSMQLESSVFGMCVVQLKPQLESLLGLPPDALTKEIQLTEDLLRFFMEYQIPSDLVSFDGPIDAPTADKVDVVKGHVKTVMDVIENAKKKQLEDEVLKADMRAEMSSLPATLYQSPSPDENPHPEFRSAVAMRSIASHSERATRSFALSPQVTRAAMAPAARMPRALVMFASQQEQQQQSSQTQSTDYAQDEVVEDLVYKQQHSVTSMTGPSSIAATTTALAVDFTMIPKLLEVNFEKYDNDSALRATIIKAARSWTRLRQENLLTKVKEAVLSLNDIKSEKNKALDLLDALSRSGSLPISCAELHVVVAVTHCFEEDVMDTVIQRNVNPIEKVEKSSLLVASTIHGTLDVRAMLVQNPPQVARLAVSFPALFDASTDSEETHHAFT